MIRFDPGILVHLADARGVVATASGHRHEAVVAAPPPVIGDHVVLATTTTRIGVDRLTLRAVLGADDQAGGDVASEGLQHKPVVLCAEHHVEVVLAGARRAGVVPVLLQSARRDPGLRLLRLAADGAEVLIWVTPGGAGLDLVRTLAGRPLPVLPLPELDRMRERFRGAHVDAHVPVPMAEGAARRTVWDPIRALSLEERHHLVEVDPRPAFTELGRDPASASLEQLAAGAAGVLAARLAAGSRRWIAAEDRPRRER